MRNAILPRPLPGIVSFTVATCMTSAVAMAACGGAPTLVALSGLVGPPSITATEASTDQALELIRKRREEASGSCPSGFTRSGGNCVPAGAASTPAPQVAAATPPPVAVSTTTTTGPASSAAAPRPKAAPRPASAATPAAPQVASAQPAPSYSPSPSTGYSGGSIKDGGYAAPMPGTIRVSGAWVEGYYDHEKHTNLNPSGGVSNNPTRLTTSGGTIAGVDVSQYSTGAELRGWQLGFISGYNSTRSKFSDTLSNKTQNNGTVQPTLTTEQRQEVDGAFAGIYGAFVQGGFSVDGAFKVDFFNMDARSIDTPVGCGVVVGNFASTAMTNYTVASNANYRMPMSANSYIEPTVGVRYTVTDFGGKATAVGVRDGEAFRVQGGVRLGTRFVTADGWIWHTSLAGLLYSDVSINGYTLVTSFPGASPLVSAKIDEGKLRGMGILETRVDVGYGYTLYNDLEVRGGQDLLGFGARVGIRKQW